MTSTDPLNLDAIETRANAATPGPWRLCDDYSDVLNPDGYQLASYAATADGEFIAHAPEDVRALLAEIRRLQAALDREERLHGGTIDDRDHARDMADKLAYAVATEDAIGEHTADNSPWANALDLITSKTDVDKLRTELAAERERYTAGLRRADEQVNAMSEELKRYADGKETPVLWSVYNAMHSRAATAEGRITSVLALCDKAEKQATRWEQPLPVPEWVTAVRAAVEQAAARRTLTEAEHDRAWHAIEGAAGEEGADPGTVLNAVLRALGLNPPTEETHVVADDSDDPEHIDDCPGCEARVAEGAQR